MEKNIIWPLTLKWLDFLVSDTPSWYSVYTNFVYVGICRISNVLVSSY